MSTPSYLPAGSALASWISAGAKEDRSRRITLWVYRWRAYWFDKNWRRQEVLYPVADFEGEGGSNLIFIMGLWRSGTTLMHELLAAGPQMAAPRTWQCMNPSTFRVGGPPTAGPTVARPMDAVVVSAPTPQEDEFALLARGAPSAYRAWLDPRRWQEVLPALAQDTWMSLPTQTWFDDWRTFLRWCFHPEATTLVIKSPNHVFRLMALHRAWPNARFVWTLRDPVETWLSNRKMWSAMTGMYGLWQWRPDDLDRFLLKAFQEYSATLSWAVKSLGSADAIYVDFDRLRTATTEALQGVTTHMRLGDWRDWKSLVQTRLDESARHQNETHSMTSPLPDSAAAVIDEIRGLHRRILSS